jgi:hypothetical protein
MDETEPLDAVQLAIQEIRRTRLYSKAASSDPCHWFWDVQPPALWIDKKAYILGKDGEYHNWPEGEDAFRAVFGDEIIDADFKSGERDGD